VPLRHRTRDIMFCLVVDDFGVRFKTQAGADHLIQTIEEYEYKLKVGPIGDVCLVWPLRSTGPTRPSQSLLCQDMFKRCYTDFAPNTYFPATATPKHLASTSLRPSLKNTNSLHRQIRKKFSHLDHRTSSHHWRLAILRACRRSYPTTNR
jgi:hypothetical protein